MRICVQKLRRTLRRIGSSREAPASFRVHIGHSFWGAGNVGDDFMLAGFLQEIVRLNQKLHFTCCVFDNLEELRQRYPEIEWREYTIAARWNAIESANSWLGLGGTPFQSDSGCFFERHLEQEWSMCRAIGIPMDFLGIGVEHAVVLNRPGFRRVFESVRRCWARDELSASWLNSVVSGRTTSAADLANILFSKLCAERPAMPVSRAVGYLLNFEKLTGSETDALPALLKALPADENFWLVQDQRLLPGMERYWWNRLPEPVRDNLRIVELGFDGADIVPAEMPGTVVSSRYHGALLAAWRGSRVVIVARSGKLTGLARQLGVQSVDFVHDIQGIVSGVSVNTPVPPEKLDALAKMASESVREWLTLARSWPA